MTSGLIWALTGVLLAVGLVGSVLPSLPGLVLIFATALLHGFLTDFSQVGWPTLTALGIMAGAMQVLDYLAGVWGVKKLGGSRWGMAGSLVGSLVGFFVLFGLIGLAIGAFAGAVLGEILGARQELGASLKIGLGSLLGLLAGTLIRVVVALAMIVIFLAAAI